MNYHVIICSILSLSIASPILATAQTERGQAFSDPAKKMKMPAGWEAQPVKYEEKIKNADLVISFGQQTYPALHKLVEQYAKEHKMNIVIQSGTCGISAGKVIKKLIDSGTFCCPPSTKDRLPGIAFHTLAISSIAVFANSKNPIQGITTKQAREIFKGKIRHWNKLGNGANLNKPIKTEARLHCKTRPGHWTLLLKNQELFSPTLKEVGVIPDLVAKVGQELHAVSVETPFMIKTYSKKGTVKMLHIDGHSPMDIDYVASGQYPFYRTYSMTSWSNNSKQQTETLKLIAYLQAHIEKNYHKYDFVPISKLKQAGWKFKGTELIGEPSGNKLVSLPPF